MRKIQEGVLVYQQIGCDQRPTALQFIVNLFIIAPKN
jgi:hypothetical protein